MKKIIFMFLILGSLLLNSCTNEEFCGDMNLSEAREIAMNSECTDEGSLKENYLCNENTNTWWIDLNIEGYPLCNPACVINTETGDAEINWRCTGAMP